MLARQDPATFALDSDDTRDLGTPPKPPYTDKSPTLCHCLSTTEVCGGAAPWETDAASVCKGDLSREEQRQTY